MADEAFNWECPYCRHKATVTDAGRANSHAHFKFAPKQDGASRLYAGVIRCPNPACLEMTLDVSLVLVEFNPASTDWKVKKRLQDWQLLPESSAKPQPHYIPKPITDDYYEACRIRNLSPKASATLARRCLQGVIRDFWQIKKNRLIDEIAELEGQIDGDLWDAIDGVRKVGNIGAHMEKDVSVIVEVDPSEAQLLIELLELLFEETYVRREDRKRRTGAVKALADSKKPVSAPTSDKTGK